MTNNLRLRLTSFILIVIMLVSVLSGCKSVIPIDDIPGYSGQAYVEINGGNPYFTEDEITTEAFESYSPLDTLGRCGVAFACLGIEIMPTEDRDDIANITPSGWEYNGVSNNNTYDFVENKYVYNRCHLIGFQLAGENDNERNLITGTRYMNIEGMLPFENKVADYIEDSGNHVMYRVTPIYDGFDYVAQGVLMEALSVEDNGIGIKFCIFAYNVQPGVKIDYFTGANVASGEEFPKLDTENDDRLENKDEGENKEEQNPSDKPAVGGATKDNCDYILNTNSKKFHLPGKSCAERISEENRDYHLGTREELIDAGYDPCGTCKP